MGLDGNGEEMEKSGSTSFFGWWRRGGREWDEGGGGDGRVMGNRHC